MAEFPHVSIVVIDYNEANNLHQTFKSIETINYPKDKMELIYVDSGSTDGSVEIARKYTDKLKILIKELKKEDRVYYLNSIKLMKNYIKGAVKANEL